ncbi:MAG: AAA family ATPase [Acidimicrobiia bacterium]|nr:AAA family ATPase [Acidimicrobiia bacterium]
MAFLIPENIPSRSSVPDRLRHVARAVRDFLPDETTVWLEANDDEPPYLLVLDPGAGILLMEAPPAPREGRRRPRWMRQVLKEEAIVGIREDVAERAAYLQARIDRSLVRSLPVCHVVAFPDRDQPVEGLQLSDNQALLLGTDMTETRLHTSVRRILGAEISTPLSEQEENRVRAEINPGVVIDPKVIGAESERGQTLPLFQEPDVAPQDIIRVMDRRQERLAEHMGWGYRMLRGVAGSGKTLVLTHRARFLHDNFRNFRILVLCYNRLLANALEATVGRSDRMTVFNIDRLAYRLAGRAGAPGKLDFEDQRRRAVDAANRLPDSRRYDIVLVDEAQDFDHAGLDLAYAMLKTSRRNLQPAGLDLRSYHAGHLVLALDSAQNVYRRAMTWNPPEMTARGRTTIFRRNYRNTRQILELAWSFLDGSATEGSTTRLDEDGVILPEASYRQGPVPRVLECGDLRDEAGAMAAEVARLVSEGVNVKDIAIMYGHRDLQDELWKECRRRSLPYFHIQHRGGKRSEDRRDLAMSIRDRVRVSTIHGLKGLEFSRIVIGGVNQVYAHDVPEEEQTGAAKRIVYVGMTRAMDELVITYSGAGELGHALRNACRA